MLLFLRKYKIRETEIKDTGAKRERRASSRMVIIW